MSVFLVQRASSVQEPLQFSSVPEPGDAKSLRSLRLKEQLQDFASNVDAGGPPLAPAGASRRETAAADSAPPQGRSGDVGSAETELVLSFVKHLEGIGAEIERVEAVVSTALPAGVSMETVRMWDGRRGRVYELPRAVLEGELPAPDELWERYGIGTYDGRSSDGKTYDVTARAQRPG